MPVTMPLKHASSTDYTPDILAFTTIAFALSTIALCARIWARTLIKSGAGVDDLLALVGWLGLFANAVANYLIATSGGVGVRPPSPHDVVVMTKAILSVAYSYSISITASRLSLLFLLRRIFRMQVTWFRIGWWVITSLVVAWLVMALAFGSLQIAGKVGMEFSYDYAVPAVTFTNAFIDLFVLVLPIGQTYGLQLPTRQRAAVIAIFALGSAGTVTSLVRAARSIQSRQEHWDPRYQLYSEAMIGLAEAATINICACLPTLRPLFRGLTSVTKKGFSSIGIYPSSESRSRRSGPLGSGHLKEEEADADASIVLKDHPAGIARTTEWHVDSVSEAGSR